MRSIFGRAAALLFSFSAAASISIHACKEPTQLTVEVRTLGFRCSELRRVSILVAQDPSAAEAKWEFPQAEVDTHTSCASDDEVGTLVITPSGDRGAVVVLASYTDDRCRAPDYRGCIVARRRFSFVENVPLRLPITLEASCKDVPCNALSSCRSGACVSSEAECTTDGTCATPAEPVVAPDGGTIPPPDDATIDIPPNDAHVSPDVGPPDAAADTSPPFDSGPDSGPDVVKGTSYGNDCPTSPVRDCHDTDQVCCAYMTFSCSDAATDAATEGGPGGEGGVQTPTFACMGTGHWYPCTGKKHCQFNEEFCCYQPNGSGTTPYSACASVTSGGTGCASGVFLCNTDDDCPGATRCNTIHMTSVYNFDGGPQMKQCGPP